MTARVAEVVGAEAQERRPTAIYLTNAPPVERRTGGSMREFELLTRLSRDYDIHLFVFAPEFDEQLPLLESTRRFARTSVLVETAGSAGRPAGVGRRVWQSRCPQGVDLLRARIAEVSPEIVHVVGHFLMQHVPAECPAPIVLCNDNIEFQLERDFEALGESVEPLSWSFTRLEELAAWRRSAVCVTLTTEDTELMAREAPDVGTFCIPTAFDHVTAPERASPRSANGPVALYFGNFGWGPTLDAARHLVDEVWPRVIKVLPDARLVMAGTEVNARFEGEDLARLSIELRGGYGELADLARDARVLAYPCRYGGGIKTKVIEALRVGLAVVTSPQALGGLPQGARDAILVGRSPEDIAMLLCMVLESAVTLDHLSDKGARAVQALPTWDQAAEAQGEVWRNATARSKAGRPRVRPRSAPDPDIGMIRQAGASA